MKVKVYPDQGQTKEEAEEMLEKAIATKQEAREDRYARESYHNDHLDQFHDHVITLHERLVTNMVDEVQDLVKRSINYQGTLVGLDILRRLDEIIERAYTDFTFQLLGRDFLTQEQQTQIEALGLLVGNRPLIELLYLLVRQISSPNYRKDKNLNILLDQIAMTGVLPNLRDTDMQTLEHGKVAVNEAVQASKNELKKQVKSEILKVNAEHTQKQTVQGLTSLPKNQELVEESSNKLLRGLAYAAVGATVFRLFRREFTSAMTQLVNTAIVDQLTNPLLAAVAQVAQPQGTDPLVYKEVVKDDRLSPECRRLHCHEDWTPKVYKLSELVANGTNVGRAKSQWKAVIGGTHPNCRCVIRPATPEQVSADQKGRKKE
jgi:hypothetical protein